MQINRNRFSNQSKSKDKFANRLSNNPKKLLRSRWQKIFHWKIKIKIKITQKINNLLLTKSRLSNQKIRKKRFLTNRPKIKLSKNSQRFQLNNYHKSSQLKPNNQVNRFRKNNLKNSQKRRSQKKLSLKYHSKNLLMKSNCLKSIKLFPKMRLLQLLLNYRNKLWTSTQKLQRRLSNYSKKA